MLNVAFHAMQYLTGDMWLQMIMLKLIRIIFQLFAIYINNGVGFYSLRIRSRQYMAICQSYLVLLSIQTFFSTAAAIVVVFVASTMLSCCN